MRHPRIIIASVSLAAAAAIGGGITAAAATTSHASSQPAASQAAAATVRTVQATVGGKTETILVNSQGLPLYYYLNDTAAKSVVTGGLAALWPPLTSGPPAATGLTGKLAAVMDIHGDQVAYNGHLLYTFADDQPGQVTGQGVQGFLVATPGLTPIAGSSAPASTVPAASSGSGYGYRGGPLSRSAGPSFERGRRTGIWTQDLGQADMTITRPAPAGRKHVARMAAGSVALASVAALTVAGVAERAAVAASFAVLGHLRWLWIPACLLLESASMAAFAIMLRRLLAAGGASVGTPPAMAHLPDRATRPAARASARWSTLSRRSGRRCWCLADPKDTVVPFQTARRLARALPDAHLQLVEGAGHHLPRRAPEAVADAIVAFLAAAQITDIPPITQSATT